MKYYAPIAAACLMPTMVWAADPPQTIDHAALTDRLLVVLERQFGAFQDETATLQDTATKYCNKVADRGVIEEAFANTWRAWAPLDAYQFGPIETQAAALTVNFFPDKKNFVGRAVSDLLKRPETQQADPTVIATSSAGTQGLPALERLLFDDKQTCPALVGVAGNLARIGTELYEGWFAADGWADLVRDAGPDNPVYLSHQEFTRQLFTALDFSIMRLREHRIGRALGTYQRSFPKRAEAWRSGITNDIMVAQISGMIDIVEDGFAGAVPDATQAQITRITQDIQTRIQSIGAPLSKALDDPQSRIRVEAVQTNLDYLKLRLDQEVGRALDVKAGFSAGDGD